MNVNNVTLAKVGVKPSQFPQGHEYLPEFAFVGKSNVGKSSLINTMVNRKKLARTSQNPGKTRTINFYNIEDLLYFVDLPGYGYAKISKSESEMWGKMIEGYLNNRQALKCIVMLIDIRHPMGKGDIQMLDWLRFYGHDIIIVATKADKLTRNQLFKQKQLLKKEAGVSEENFFTFSSETRDGKEELWKRIMDYCNSDEQEFVEEEVENIEE